ncbi:ortholog of Bordetella pertussis (BX470248) BP3819 [plant metagenome]|uniref:Ortholog of Bordetella pertussis (BX470248) BP3819 n=1 Tax=plant metagenome TaxID=1297885 RepID=A0A484P510_9ZZZZ
MPSQQASHPVLSRRPLGRVFVRCAGAAAVTLLAGACAQQAQPGYYNPPAESTITDAQTQYQDSRGRGAVRPPSQIQLELKPDQPGQPGQPARTTQIAEDTPITGRTGGATSLPNETPSPVNPMAARVIPEPLTFLGTVPCFTPALNCMAQRVSLTLSPNGRWRARSTSLGAQAKPAVEQGCWRGIPERPARVIVQEANGNTRAELLMVANNVLQVRSVGGQSPNLEYRLTRQPDLDAIDELAKAAPPACD